MKNNLKRYQLHSMTNKLAIPVLTIMFGVGVYFINRDAENTLLRVIGIVALLLLFVLSMYLFLYMYKAMDYLIFTDDNIILGSMFRKNEIFKYEDYYCTIGLYTTKLSAKQILIFTPKSIGKIFVKIDTTRFGNCTLANKHKILYCFYDKGLLNILKSKANLTYIKNE